MIYVFKRVFWDSFRQRANHEAFLKNTHQVPFVLLHLHPSHLSLVSSIFFIIVLEGTRYMSRWLWLVWM